MEKTVKVDEKEWKELNQEKLDRGLDKISDVIKENITFSKRFNNEKQFCDWFEKHFGLFEFTRIIKKQVKTTPDYIVEFEGKELRVEIETLSSHFIQHEHNPKDVDLVICLIQDKKLSVKTIEIGKFEYLNPTNNLTTITVTKMFKSVLALHGIYGETQEAILLRLLPDDYATKFSGDKRITKIYSKEDVDSFKMKKKRREK